MVQESLDWIEHLTRERLKHERDELSIEVWGHDREWWREEAKRTKTDWSSLLRQRILFLWWVREGRQEPRAEWLRGKRDNEDSVD
jgi:hypothetical protein